MVHHPLLSSTLYYNLVQYNNSTVTDKELNAHKAMALSEISHTR